VVLEGFGHGSHPPHEGPGLGEVGEPERPT